MKYFSDLILCLSGLFASLFGIAQQPLPQKLSLHEPVTANLSAGQVIRYRLVMEKGRFASVKIFQKSVGIGYAVYDPAKRLVSTGDYNALFQTEIIGISATETGEYCIDVFWDYGRPQRGDFVITWDILEKTGSTPALHAEQLMRSWYDPGGPGAAVAVIKDGRIIFKSTRGLANMEERMPITGHTAFELASCSKQFTGLAVAMLLDKGRISLADDIRKYLPEMPDFGKKITIENLVYHTSGLRDWDDMANAMGLRPEDVLTTDMIYKMACNTRGLNFAPGERFSYTNTGYNLLALIIENVTGEKFGDWMKKNIFLPLEMMDTNARDDIRTVIPNRVYSYARGKNAWTANPDNITAMGSTSVYASVDDLVKWVANFESGKQYGDSVLHLLNRKSRLNNGQTLEYYAFGNGFGNRNGVRNIEHLGLVSGFRTAITRYPGQHMAIIFLCNDNNDAAYSHAWTIGDLFLQNAKSIPPEPVQFPDLKDALANTMPPEHWTCPVDTHEFEGVYYADELNSHYNLVSKAGILTAVSSRLDSIALKWEETDRFSALFQTVPRKIKFARDGNGNVNAFALGGAEKDFVFRKLR